MTIAPTLIIVAVELIPLSSLPALLDELPIVDIKTPTTIPPNERHSPELNVSIPPVTATRALVIGSEACGQC
eukprot:CAMPEP_0171303360 /NCGR_PEP_ID=MMETSP0816-20121228/12894_1 /TAXON_ID=420281 /ORGANISM="Proboscia inermis, Strain CCAP1064/1" /LENGTH=71 /DNA_ID=CAMNT_0011782561 /DNA_START=565 /DNA_END=780 /DNA_ORIENTATION=-